MRYKHEYDRLMRQGNDVNGAINLLVSLEYVEALMLLSYIVELDYCYVVEEDSEDVMLTAILNEEKLSQFHDIIERYYEYKSTL